LDDALSMIFLFASMPAGSKQDHRELVQNCQRKSAEFLQYVIHAKCLRKSFVSIKGIYYQVEIKGQQITWVVPHQFNQNVPKNVDLRVMYTFLHLYDTLVGFVLYKLYSDANLKYPPALDGAMEAEAAGIDAIKMESTRTAEAKPAESLQTKPSAIPMEQKKRLQTLQKKVQAMGKSDTTEAEEDAEIEVPEVNEAEDPADASFPENAAQDDDILSQPLVTYDALAKSVAARVELFKNLTFFISREINRTALEFIIRSLGGAVGWDAVLGTGSPFTVDDPKITHHIVDRPTLPENLKVLSKRAFVQPQWVFDCMNSGKLLLISGSVHGTGYGPGDKLPPHLSPFVEDSALEYKPLEDSTLNDSDLDEMVEEGDEIDSAQEEEESESEDDEKLAPDTNADSKPQVNDRKRKAQGEAKRLDKDRKRKAQEEADRLDMAKMMMSRKNKYLFNAMKKREQAKTDEIKVLKRKKAELEMPKGAPKRAKH
jgi:pescadillo protein